MFTYSTTKWVNSYPLFVLLGYSCSNCPDASLYFFPPFEAHFVCFCPVLQSVMVILNPDSVFWRIKFSITKHLMFHTIMQIIYKDVLIQHGSFSLSPAARLSLWGDAVCNGVPVEEGVELRAHLPPLPVLWQNGRPGFKSIKPWATPLSIEELDWCFCLEKKLIDNCRQLKNISCNFHWLLCNQLY